MAGSHYMSIALCWCRDTYFMLLRLIKGPRLFEVTCLLLDIFLIKMQIISVQ